MTLAHVGQGKNIKNVVSSINQMQCQQMLTLCGKKPATPTKPKKHTKVEFLKVVSDKTNMPQTDLEKALGGILGQIKNILGKGESIVFVEFSKFSVADHAARDGRNPQTGEIIKIPASKGVKFSAGQVLKDAVNTKKKK